MSLASYAAESRFGQFIGDEVLDCYDNDCDGEVDEGQIGAPTLTNWVLGNANQPTAHCHYRPYNDGTNEISEVILRPERRHYKLGSLTVHEGMTVKIRKNSRWVRESSEEGSSPGFRPLITVTADILDCMTDKVGGQLTLSVEELNIEAGGALRADSESSPCEITESSDKSKSINGASGGELYLFAREARLHGDLSANGAPPQPQSVSNNVTHSTRISGGAAGSIFLNSPELILRGVIMTQGGMGQCAPVNNHVATECMGPSPFSGGGPGREGGVPFNATLELGYEGGGGSGGRGYQEVNINRTLGLIGIASAPGQRTEIISADGNGHCDGEIEYGPGTKLLMEGYSLCDRTEPYNARVVNENRVLYHHTFTPLNSRGVPIASMFTYIELRNSLNEQLASTTLAVGMLGLTEPLDEGEYSIVFNGAIQDQEVRVVKVVSLNPDQPNTPRVVNVPVEVTIVEGEEVIQGIYRVE